MIGGTLGVRSSLLRYLLSKTGDKIFAISKMEAEQFPNYNKIKNDKIFIIREFVDENDFCSISDRKQTLNELNISPSSYVCLSLGGFYVYKGTIDVLLALKILIDKGEDVVLILIGNDKAARNNKNSYLNKCLNVIDENKMAKNIRLVETTSNIAKYLEASDVLISSNSISHFSRPIIEAWAKKKPIIASDLPHIREYVDDEVNGICYKVGDYEELAERIKMLIHNTEFGKKIGENGYRIARNLFDADKNINSLFSLMDV
jgi:glycosyltransferase involved in cell wall biosynthesis